MYRALPPCSACGAKRAERHHIDGNPRNNRRSNVRPLCRKCHMTLDGRLVACTKRLATMSRRSHVAA
jgi:hypothetical protein